MSAGRGEEEAGGAVAGPSTEEQQAAGEKTGQGQEQKGIGDVMGQCSGISQAITILTEKFEIIRQKVAKIYRLHRKARAWQRRWPVRLTYKRYKSLLNRKRRARRKKLVFVDKMTSTSSNEGEGMSPRQGDGQAAGEMCAEGGLSPSGPHGYAPGPLPNYQSYYGSAAMTGENYYGPAMFEEGGMSHPDQQACDSPVLISERESSPTSPTSRATFSPSSPHGSTKYSLMTPPNPVSYSPTSPVCRPHYSPASSIYLGTSSNAGSSSQGNVSYHACFSPATPEYSDVLKESLYNRALRNPSTPGVHFYGGDGDTQSPEPYSTSQEFPAVGAGLGEDSQPYPQEDPMEGPSAGISLHSQMDSPSLASETSTYATSVLVNKKNRAAASQMTQPEMTARSTLPKDGQSLDDDNDGGDEDNDDDVDDDEEDEDTDDSVNYTLGTKLSSLPENFPADPVLWTVDDVILFLNRSRSPMLMYLASLCEKHEIDGRALLLLESDVLIRHMGVKLGTALKLGHFIKCLRERDLEDD